MEITTRHWITVISIAILLHAYAIWNLNLSGNSIAADSYAQYMIDLTTFEAAPEPIKLETFVPPPPKEVKIPKPEVVTPKAEQPINVPEPEPELGPIEATSAQSTQVTRVASSVTPSRSLSEIKLEKANYYQLILDKLERLKKYPAHTPRGEQATVRLTFSLNKDGSLHSYKITKSSGFSALDRETEELIVRATPFPPVPDSMGAGKLQLSLPIFFK